MVPGGKDEEEPMLSNVKSVLVGITQESGEQEGFSALPYALSLAAQAGAHLTVQAASLKLVLTHAFVSDYAAGLVVEENRRLFALADAAADQTRGAAQAAGVACATESLSLTYPDLLEAFTGEARLNDLTVIDAEPLAISADRGLIEALIMKSGRPLVVVPQKRETFRSARVLVAWDGSAKAARAVNDALPYLRAAEAVEVVSVEGEKDLSDTVRGAGIAAHLARHGVAAAVTVLAAEDGDVAETLRRHATLSRADLLVAGAFVHSRLREAVLGGVTASLLKRCPVPLFLSY
jgi:nucleotide-binding universal stress UspA family protein